MSLCTLMHRAKEAAMAKKDNKPVRRDELLSGARAGLLPRILGFVALILAVAVAVSIVSDLNVGNVPSIFGFELSFLA